MAIYASVNIDINNGNVSNQKSSLTDKKAENIKTLSQRQRQIASKSTALVLSTLAVANSAVGAYTGNKVRQSNIQTLLSIGGIGALAISHPYIAAASATILAIKNTIDFEIRQINSRQESNFKQSYRGKMATSGSRWRGNL